MAINEFVLDEGKRWFVEEGRVDPLTREPFRMGERVVVCANCKMVYLASTWDDCGGCVGFECNCKRTKRSFLAKPARPQAKPRNEHSRPNGEEAPMPPRARETPVTEGRGELVILRRYAASTATTPNARAQVSVGEMVIIRWSKGE